MFTENKLNTAKSNKRTKETKIDNNRDSTILAPQVGRAPTPLVRLANRAPFDKAPPFNTH